MRKQPAPQIIKALALDLDGTTLLPETVLGGRTLRALNACIGRGIQIIVCTGRATEAAERFRQPIGAEGPMVYYNGAEVVDMPAGKVLSAALLDAEVIDFCVDLSRSMGVYFQVYFPGPGYPQSPQSVLASERECAETKMYLNHTGLQTVFMDLKEAAARGQGCIKCMFLGEPDVLEAVRPKLIERFGGRVFIARSHRNFLEILNSGASKGSGLCRVLEFRGLEPGEVIAAGDDENDLPMFSVAGFSVAPANAKESVREAADLVIGSNADEGLAEFLEKFFQL